MNLDIAVPGDYDGDGRTDPAIFRTLDATWWVLQSQSGAGWQRSWAGGAQVHGDYDGDGRTDPAVWRPSSGIWYALSSRTGYSSYMAWQWGSWTYGDVPVRAR